jgi:hypothetical protein
MLQTAFWGVKNQKFSGGACPKTPLECLTPSAFEMQDQKFLARYATANSTVSWSSKRQRTVAKSSTEAEYIALSLAAQEAIWLQRLLYDVGFKIRKPITIFEDNQGTIELAKNAKYHNRTKHIDICHHFIRERVQSKEINVVYCRTDDMKADILANKRISKIKL